MMVLGLDPGIRGGWAVVDVERRLCLEAGDLPTLPRRAQKGDRLAPLLLLRLLARLSRDHECSHALLEQAQAMPKQGVASTFQYGRAFGVIEACLAASAYSVLKIRPAMWKKQARLLAKQKDASRSLAIDLWPDVAYFDRKKDHQRAEAALIALYGWDRLQTPNAAPAAGH